MNADAEIAFLERLYSLPSEEEQGQMKNDPELNKLAEFIVAESELAAGRAGKDGIHCYFCGHDVPTSTCRCPHPESFRCHGKRVCADCEKAMVSVASHIASICRAKRVARVSSIRLRLYYQLTRAARAVGDEEVHNHSQLHFCLSQADPADDEPDIFRSRLLWAFGRARFLRFQALASALERESKDAMVMAIMRSGILGHPGRRSVDFDFDLKPADRQFYE